MRNQPSVNDILPPPFEWIQIPAGKVTIGYGDWEGESVNRQYVVKRTQDFDIPAFNIAKYPVTNAQYDVFVNHPDGYKNPKWWDYSDEGKQWRAGRSEMKKSYFAGGDCPRENVSWYDSVAFCLWLSAMTDETSCSPPNSNGRGRRLAIPNGYIRGAMILMRPI